MTRTLLTAIFLTLFSQTAWAEQFEGIFSCSSGETKTGPSHIYSIKIIWSEIPIN